MLFTATDPTPIENCKANPDQLDQSQIAHCKNLIYQQMMLKSKSDNFFTLKKGDEKTIELKKYTDVLLQFISAMEKTSTLDINETMDNSLEELRDLMSSLR